MNKFKLIAIHAFAVCLLWSCNQQENTSTKTTNVPDNLIEFESNGYLAQNKIDAIKNEGLKIKATSAYEYALPIVAVQQWRKGIEQEANLGDWLVYTSYNSKVPILTANTTTPYVISLIDLKESNYYLELPAGPLGGMIIDIYQSPQTDLGVVGPDKGKGGKYLLLGPETPEPESHDADFVIKSKSNLVFLGTRIIGLEGNEYEKVLRAHKLYKVGEKAETKFVNASENPKWMGFQPHGMEFWNDLSDVMQNEPVTGRNRVIMTQLRDLGMVKDQPFQPNKLQTDILTESEKLGNAIAMVNTFSRESYKEKHWPDRSWLYILNMEHLDHMHPNYWEIKEIASYTYEAVTTSTAMVLKQIGKGSKYLGAYTDNHGDWLDGKNTYEVIIPKDAPASQFWSITVYDNDTRCIINNSVKRADVSSVMNGVKVEKDGSTKVIIGPKAPKGYENNWIQSNAQKGFFAYLRLYGPLEPFYDKSWKMPNIKKMK